MTQICSYARLLCYYMLAVAPTGEKTYLAFHAYNALLMYKAGWNICEQSDDEGSPPAMIFWVTPSITFCNDSLGIDLIELHLKFRTRAELAASNNRLLRLLAQASYTKAAFGPQVDQSLLTIAFIIAALKTHRRMVFALAEAAFLCDRNVSTNDPGASERSLSSSLCTHAATNERFHAIACTSFTMFSGSQ